MSRHGDSVLLVHGLWMNRVAMFYLARRLAAHGFRARAIGYFSAMRRFEENVASVRQAIARAEGSTLHVVAHSFGGVVSLRALAAMVQHRVRRIVLLGTPIGGCAGARQLAASCWGRALLGTTKSLWLAMPQLDMPRGVQVGAIAGTRRFGLGRLLLRVPKPNDGVVAVTETMHPALTDHIALPVAHSEMLFSSRVAGQVATFLATGRFAR